MKRNHLRARITAPPPATQRGVEPPNVISLQKPALASGTCSALELCPPEKYTSDILQKKYTSCFWAQSGWGGESAGVAFWQSYSSVALVNVTGDLCCSGEKKTINFNPNVCHPQRLHFNDQRNLNLGHKESLITP